MGRCFATNRYRIIALDFDLRKLVPSFLQHYSPSTVFWVLARRFLDRWGSDFDRILLADVRDTFFQASPFDIIGESGKRCGHSSMPPSWATPGASLAVPRVPRARGVFPPGALGALSCPVRSRMGPGR